MDNMNSMSSNIKIKVIGVGGAGNNSINFLYDENINENIELWAFNTDAQDLNKNKCSNKLTLGTSNLRGFGAGGDPRLGEKYATESKEEIKKILKGTDLLILTCGLGGGTGTGATPVIAKIAKEMDILTLAIVTMPFQTIEGTQKYLIAKEGLEKLKQNIDSYVLISNQKLIDSFSALPFREAFKLSNVMLKDSINLITEILYETGLTNVDFFDLRNILKNGGETLINFYKATGKNKIVRATEEALKNPLSESDIKSCSKMIIVYKFDNKVPIAAISESNEIIDNYFGNSGKIINKKIGCSVSETTDKEDMFLVGIIASEINKNLQNGIDTGLINPNYQSSFQMNEISNDSNQNNEKNSDNNLDAPNFIGN